jgi:hypothetical protein
MKKPTPIAKQVTKRLDKIIRDLKAAKAAIGKARDPWPHIDDAYSTLNEVHGKMDEGEYAEVRGGKTKEEIKKIAAGLWETAAREEAFDEARKLHPGFGEGGEDAEQAAYYIRDRLLALAKSGEDLTEADLDALGDELNEMALAGLT